MSLNWLHLLLLSPLAAGLTIPNNSNSPASLANTTSLTNLIGPADLINWNETGPVSPHTARSQHEFHYRNNDVFLSNENAAWEIEWRTFTVTDFHLPEGQDPGSRNQKGAVHRIVGGTESFIRFNAGRLNSENTADWWNGEFAPSQNTFGHSAHRLNMAFVGDLRGVLFNGFEQKPFVVPGVGFAQGHVWWSNNWWFAGKTAVHNGKGSVLIKPEGIDLCLEFHRGGNFLDGWYNIVTVIARRTCNLD